MIGTLRRSVMSTLWTFLFSFCAAEVLFFCYLFSLQIFDFFSRNLEDIFMPLPFYWECGVSMLS